MNHYCPICESNWCDNKDHEKEKFDFQENLSPPNRYRGVEIWENITRLNVVKP